MLARLLDLIERLKHFAPWLRRRAAWRNYLRGQLATWLQIRRYRERGDFFLSPIDGCAYQDYWTYAGHLMEHRRLPEGFDDPGLADAGAAHWPRVPVGLRRCGEQAA